MPKKNGFINNRLPQLSSVYFQTSFTIICASVLNINRPTVIMGLLDPRLFRNPTIWTTEFHETDLLALQTFILKMIAMVPINFDKYLPSAFVRLSSLLNRLLIILLAFFILNIIVVCFIEFYNLKENGTLEEITYLITVCIIGLFSFFSMSYYQLTYTSYLTIVDYINKNFRHRSAFGLTCVTGEQAYLFAKRFSFYWSVICMGATLQWVALAILAGNRSLPVIIKYTFIDQYQTPYYQILFLLHICYQYVTALGFATGGYILLSIVVIICGQFDILFCSLKNLRNTAMVFHGRQVNNLK